MRRELKERWSPRGALVVLAGVLVSLALGCAGPAPGSVARGQELFAACQSCHGVDGSGSQMVGAPSIAGLPAWYVTKQLGDFKKGGRAYHPDDVTGLHMRPMTLTLTTDQDVTAVAAYVASLPPVAPADTLAGDATAGQTSYAVCLACHGPQAAGNEALHAPPIRNQPDWYIVGQLEKFKSGMRGKPPADLPPDPYGAQMLAMSQILPDEQAMKNVAAYIHTL